MYTSSVGVVGMKELTYIPSSGNGVKSQQYWSELMPVVHTVVELTSNIRSL